MHAAARKKLLVALALLPLIAIPSALLVGKEAEAVAAEDEDRYLMHLATCRPAYRPGEEVRVRGLLLHALTRRPYAGDGQRARGRDLTRAKVVVRSARGDVVAEGVAAGEGASLGFVWPIPAAAAGGFYTLEASPHAGYAPATVRFEVRSYRLARLRTELEFVRKAYGPGDEAEAILEVTRAEGGIPAGARATVVARIDGEVAHREVLALDAEGKLLVRFRIPERVRTPDATLAIVIEDGGVQETAARTIPLVLAHVGLTLFPEGGELVAGLPARVYFEARTATDDPADVRGRVVDDRGQVVARLASEHEGRGRFSFLPAPGRSYAIQIDEPAGVSARTALPPVRSQGLVLESRGDVVAAGESLRLRLAGVLPPAFAGERRARVVVALRERELASAEVALRPEGEELALELPGWAAGALRVTAYDSGGTPRAERLVFRRPVEGLQVTLTANPAGTTPGAPVTLRVETRDAAGAPVDAWVALSVVDDSALTRVERRDRAPRLPAQVLLGSDVRELKDAQRYLDEADRDEGALATDLLLGTQGWRRFGWVQADAFVAAHGDAARRALGLKGPAIVEEPELMRPMALGRRFRGGELEGAGGPPAAPAAEMDELAAGAAPDGDALPELQRAAREPAPEPEPMAPADQPAPALAERRDALEERMDRDEAREEDRAEPFARARRPMPMPPPPPPGPFRWERVFAHQADGARARTRFEETVYWNAGVRTGLDGATVVRFDLSDSVTTFRALADAVAPDGALAWAETTVEARRPFYIEAKLPLEVTGGDLLEVPVAAVNGTGARASATVRAELGGDRLALITGREAAHEQPLSLGPEGRARRLVPLRILDGQGEVALRLRGTLAAGRAHEDALTRTIKVVPSGFPIERTWGGELSAARPLTGRVSIPAEVTPGSLEAEAVLYPTPLASLVEALAALLREPSGCFEQTSSSNYPNVMAMQYMRSHRGVDPALLARTAGMIERGYGKLVSFECRERGYEWFGGDPGHEALTAYGLLQFKDMEEVAAVDGAMVARTRRWLLARRDGEGGFKRNARALDSFGRAPDEVTNAYITWALVEAGETECGKEVDAVLAGATASEDPYVLGLAANICLARGDAARARGFTAKLAQAQAADGSLPGARTSVTMSGGESLLVETTALAVMAWLRDPAHTEPVERAMRWLLGRCRGGRFGSTQATVLALRAVVAYGRARATPRAPGVALVLVDGDVVDELPFGADTHGPLRLPDFAHALGAGEREIELRMRDGSPLPSSVVVRYRAPVPATSPAAQVRIETSLTDERVEEGEATEVLVRVENVTDGGLPMTVAIVGLPGGLEVRTDRLEELQRAGAFDFVETRGREVILYWRDLAPGAVKEVVLSAVAAVPGRTTGPASRAYLYYTDEDKHWAPGLTVTIPAREGEAPAPQGR